MNLIHAINQVLIHGESLNPSPVPPCGTLSSLLRFQDYGNDSDSNRLFFFFKSLGL